MTKLRDEEAWAAACMQAALLGVQVRQNDDQSSPGMYDLRLSNNTEQFGAAEVTAAVDGVVHTLWKLMNGNGRWIEPRLAGGWFITLLPSARAKQLFQKLPPLLAKFEESGIDRLISLPKSHPLSVEAADLKIVRASQGGTNFPGSIYITVSLPPSQTGGFVPENGAPLVNWVQNWIIQPEQADNLVKLENSEAEERHLFVIVPGFTTAPFEVVDLLMRSTAPIPTIAPTLPAQVTHLWIASTWASGKGFRWSPNDGWTTFEKATEIAAPESPE